MQGLARKMRVFLSRLLPKPIEEGFTHTDDRDLKESIRIQHLLIQVRINSLERQLDLGQIRKRE